MKFQQTVNLIGVVGKKGSGQLDNGQAWVTDRVELHVQVPFSEAETMAHGSTVTVYNVEDFNAHYDNAKALVGREVILDMEMQPAKKLGQAAKIICVGFSKPLVSDTAKPDAVKVNK